MAEASLQRWHPVLDAVARISLAVEDDVDALLSVGAPDHRLATLATSYDALMDEIDAEPRFREARELIGPWAAELASYGVRETLEHDDLHDGQVFVRDGRHWVLDWGDACVTHPFFVLTVTLEGQLSWGLDDVEGSVDTAPFRDSFLRPYQEAYHHLSAADLVDAARVAARLGWVARAVNGHLPDHPGHTTARLEMFVDARTSDEVATLRRGASPAPGSPWRWPAASSGSPARRASAAGSRPPGSCRPPSPRVRRAPGGAAR